MPRIAFATCAAHPDGMVGDVEAADLLGVDFRVWDDESVDWYAYERVVIRSVWDYTSRIEEFLAWVDAVGDMRLRNRPALVRFNADKRYLLELGVPTVPTTLVEPGETLPPYGEEIVVKPNVSAGGRDTGRFAADARDQAVALLESIHESGRTALVQPYLAGVEAHGERAITFVGGSVSHVLHKRPVLREPGVAPVANAVHGPATVMLEPDLVTPGSATPAQLDLAHAAHAEITARFDQPLFARVDVVPGPDGSPVLIELEAIEPRLYQELVAGGPERFAAAVAASL